VQCRAVARLFDQFIGALQSICFAGHSREPSHVLLRVVSVDVDHWLLATAKAAVVDTRVAIAVVGADVPVGECQLIIRYGKGPGDRNHVLRLFIWVLLSAVPIMSGTAGTTTISGQRIAHSLNESPGLRARSCTAVSTCGRTCETIQGHVTVYQRHCAVR
jgi:hypothetical protein